MHFKHLLAIAALITATAASAAPQHGPHTYVLVDAGVSSLTDTDTSEAEKASLGVTFGVQLNPGFALETGYKNFGSRYDIDFQAFTFSAVGSLPITRSFDFVGKAGLAYTAASQSGYGTNAGISKVGYVIGAGVDYRINRDWSARALLETYPDYAGSTSNMSNLSVGLKYKF